MIDKTYCVYILSNLHNTVLYTGVTNNLHRRVTEHRNEEGSIFSRKYIIRKLVYYEFGDSIEQAILREKQIKAGSRKKKIELIESLNPDWNDLFEGLF